MYKLKNLVKRGSALLGAAGLLAGVGSSAIPAFVSADALNPLTERSLTLSSGSPGWAFTDGSGNGTYAYPGSGANGQKTGNTFSFRVSTGTSKTIHAMTFQYCTHSAGLCTAPGNNSPLTAANDTTGASGKSDLEIVTSSPSQVSSTDWPELDPSKAGSTYLTEQDYTDGDSTHHAGIPDANNDMGNFIVLTSNDGTNWSVPQYDSDSDSTPDADVPWTMTATNQEESTTVTTKANMITLTSTQGISLSAGTYVKVIFYATDTNYITNPGADAFFVKINTYDDASYQDWADNTPTAGHTADVIDGGVTVANVMNQSIEIQTKVLETMEFSVGTVDPDTLTDAQYTTAKGTSATHGTCDNLLPAISPTASGNTLLLGNSDAENSLETGHTYATHSYWRLSSNSSNGATVYYSGVTLSNTEGDQIDPIGVTATAPSIGTEQFGLALDNGTSSGNYAVNYSLASDTKGDGTGTRLESGADAPDGNLVTGLSSDWVTYQAAHSQGVHNPQLAPLAPTTNYGGGTGGINDIDTGGIATDFAFDPNSNTVPTPMATEDDQVVDCVTGKVRYIANIAATTPAGIYTTKINYIAAPQY